MKRTLRVMIGLLMVVSAGVQANRQISPDVQVNAAGSVQFGRAATAPPCNQCCIYEGKTILKGGR
jgi:hypothetical protein